MLMGINSFVKYVMRRLSICEKRFTVFIIKNVKHQTRFQIRHTIFIYRYNMYIIVHFIIFCYFLLIL